MLPGLWSSIGANVYFKMDDTNLCTELTGPLKVKLSWFKKPWQAGFIISDTHFLFFFPPSSGK